MIMSQSVVHWGTGVFLIMQNFYGALAALAHLCSYEITQPGHTNSQELTFKIFSCTTQNTCRASCLWANQHL